MDLAEKSRYCPPAIVPSREVDSSSEYKITEENHINEKQQEYEYDRNFSPSAKYEPMGPFPNQSTQNWRLVGKNTVGRIPVIPRPAMPPPSVIKEMKQRKRNQQYSLQGFPKQSPLAPAFQSHISDPQQLNKAQQGTKTTTVTDSYSFNGNNFSETLFFRSKQLYIPGKDRRDASKNTESKPEKSIPTDSIQRFENALPHRDSSSLNSIRRDNILREYRKRDDILQNQINVANHWKEQTCALWRKHEQSSLKNSSTKLQKGEEKSNGVLGVNAQQEENEIEMNRQEINDGATPREVFYDDSGNGWVEYWDEEVGASYYYNISTGEASWVNPTDATA